MLSAKPWKPEAVLCLGLGVFICAVLGGVLAAVTRLLLGPGSDHVLARILSGVIGFQGAALVLIAFFLRTHHIGWADAFGFRNRGLRAALLGLLSTCLFLPPGLGLLAVTMKLMVRFGLPVEEQSTVQILREAGAWPAQLLMAFIAIVLAPFVEEILFRGILYPVIKQAGHPRAALWGTSLLFAAIHNHLPSFLPLLLLALMLIWLYEKTDNLLAPIAAHSLFNALNFAMLHFADQLEQWRLPHP